MTQLQPEFQSRNYLNPAAPNLDLEDAACSKLLSKLHKVATIRVVA